MTNAQLSEARERAVSRGEAEQAERRRLLKKYPVLGRWGWRPIQNLRRGRRQILAAKHQFLPRAIMDKL